MQRILHEIPVAPFDERPRLREHILRLNVARHRLGVQAQNVLVRGREHARSSKRRDDLLPISASLFAHLGRWRERTTFRDRLRVIDDARARLSREKFEARRFWLRPSSSHQGIIVALERADRISASSLRWNRSASYLCFARVCHVVAFCRVRLGKWLNRRAHFIIKRH